MLMYQYVYTIKACPCCLSERSSERWSIVAPFLAHFAVEQPPFLCKLLECSDCSFRFFNVRLTPDEVDRLYSDIEANDTSRSVIAGNSGTPARSTPASAATRKKLPTRVGGLERLVLPCEPVSKVGERPRLRRRPRIVHPTCRLEQTRSIVRTAAAVPVNGVTRIVPGSKGKSSHPPQSLPRPYSVSSTRSRASDRK